MFIKCSIKAIPIFFGNIFFSIVCENVEVKNNWNVQFYLKHKVCQQICLLWVWETLGKFYQKQETSNKTLITTNKRKPEGRRNTRTQTHRSISLQQKAELPKQCKKLNPLVPQKVNGAPAIESIPGGGVRGNPSPSYCQTAGELRQQGAANAHHQGPTHSSLPRQQRPLHQQIWTEEYLPGVLRTLTLNWETLEQSQCLREVCNVIWTALPGNPQPRRQQNAGNIKFQKRWQQKVDWSTT